ncbi:DUF5696 domain-containing protein [Paenibacillus hamazuiensis]|uniref:DUF5696 domain-containing protein n=1 Tax=Paenibacillus hamazuiensis TaxID=2936508 RepID=UPI0020104D67|nr:DUF5696 domain-containing protein [Paenibacillus hamazuiensis]
MNGKTIRYLTTIGLVAAISLSAAIWQSGAAINAADPQAAQPEKPAAESAAPAAQNAAPAAGNAARPAAGTQAAPAAAAQAAATAGSAANDLPSSAAFKPAAESAQLKLLADSVSGHFIVEDKRNGNVWRSYPDPEYWSKETITGTWRNNLRSPAMVELIDMANFKSQPKIVSLIEDKGAVEGFQTTSNGFKLTFNFKTSGFKIPVEVTLNGDAVEIKVVDSGIQEGKLSLLNLKVYPLFGAEPSAGQEGYIVIPDGSGALIDFKENRTGDKSVYRETIYGNDAAFFSERTNRLNARMPVFGMKSGDKAFLAVMEGGEEYARLFASPSGAYGTYNWVTPELQYRIKFFQNTSKKAKSGFYTYSKKPFSASQRVTKYFLLDSGASDYVGMASRYREYLMKEKGLKRLQTTGSKLPMFVDIIGADLKKGLLWDNYIKATTTSEAMEMIKRLYGLGIEKMNIGYLGWQTNGYSSFGGLFPVDKRLGGNEGMKQFIQFAHSLQFPVYLGANYTLNNNDGDGFNERYDGLRNLAGQVLDFPSYSNGDMVTLVSPKFTEKVIEKDLAEYKSLGADGIYYEDGIGRFLNSDFNDDYLSTRTETMNTYRNILKKTAKTLGGVRAERPNFYQIGELQHMHRMEDDYSYDLFVDRPIPFAQIALHGLITYTSEWANMRDQYRGEFLRSIEYGSHPSFIFTSAESREMKGAYWIWYYSLNYRDWETTAVEEYQRYNQALGDVQSKFIVGHRTLAPKVNETTYEGGKKIIVNYDTVPYSAGGITVPAQDFIVIPGGAGK